MDSCIPHQLLVHAHFRIFPCRDRAFACRHMQMHLDSHFKLKSQNIWVANSHVRRLVGTHVLVYMQPFIVYCKRLIIHAS